MTCRLVNKLTSPRLRKAHGYNLDLAVVGGEYSTNSAYNVMTFTSDTTWLCFCHYFERYSLLRSIYVFVVGEGIQVVSEKLAVGTLNVMISVAENTRCSGPFHDLGFLLASHKVVCYVCILRSAFL